MNHLDIIGDIHGQYDKLTALLSALGYRPEAATWKHPAGRRVVFLGDYIDRGPRIRDVLHLVRAMMESGDALAIMGNHEYNAIGYHTPDGKGDYLRPRFRRNREQHAATVAAFAERPEEWETWIDWMKGLPFFLDLGGLRAVHAAWHPDALPALQGATLRDPAFLKATTVKGTAEFLAVEILLKGVELPLPADTTSADKDGHLRKAIRGRWWENAPEGMNYQELIFPPADTPPPVPVSDTILQTIPGYETTEPPAFVGHYWLPATTPRAPLTHNVACLDFSAAREGPLVAYRWDGEQTLTADKFFTAANP